MVFNVPDAHAGRGHGPDGARTPKPSVVTPALIVLTIFFMLLSLSNAGIGNFGVVALMSGYGASFSSANIALTAFLGASAAGVLAGGCWPTAPAASWPGRRRLFRHQRGAGAGHRGWSRCRRSC